MADTPEPVSEDVRARIGYRLKVIPDGPMEMEAKMLRDWYREDVSALLSALPHTEMPTDVRSALHVLDTYASGYECGAKALERQGEGMSPPAMAQRQYARDLRTVAETLSRAAYAIDRIPSGQPAVSDPDVER